MITRPHYETTNDLRAERAVARRVAQHLNRAALKLSPALYGVDFALVDVDAMRPRVCEWLEVKVRANPAGQYTTYLLSAAKWARGRMLSDTTGLPFLLAVQWTDRLGVCYVPGTLMSQANVDAIYTGGRVDRDDECDTEPVVLIPVASFSTVP